MSDIIRECNAVIDNFSIEVEKLRREIHADADNRIKEMMRYHLPENFEFEVTPEKISGLQRKMNSCLDEIRVQFYI